jgi:phage FluMu gp28-like protein
MKPKKDLNYIAKVEKAIAKKYGDIAIQNPASFWNEEKEKKYLEQLKEETKQQEETQCEEQIDAGGFFVPRKLINKDTSRICPACEIYSVKALDDVYMSKYDCCYKCYILYVEGREERWLKGWRPKDG